jgi:hypothetical protein
MQEPASATISEHFSSLKDPRIQLKTRHKLIDIIVITVCAVICGADYWLEVVAYAKAEHGWFKTFLELPHEIPSHAGIPVEVAGCTGVDPPCPARLISRGVKGAVDGRRTSPLAAVYNSLIFHARERRLP